MPDHAASGQPTGTRKARQDRVSAADRPAPTVTFLGHAGLSVDASAFRLVCDPWFDSAGANLGSWHQYPRNDHLDLEPLKQADWIAVTHDHLDHFDPWFLAQLPSSARVLIPRYPAAGFRRMVEEAGVGTIVELAPWQPFPLDNRGSWIIAIPDVSPMWHDAAFLIVADGFAVLNCNDAKLTPAQTRRAKRMAGGALSLMALQTSRAAWHPMAYDNYSRDEVRRISWEKKLAKLRSAARLVRATAPELAVPFAGPPCFLDAGLRENNWVLDRGADGAYTDPEEARAWLSQRLPQQQWEVFRPGDRIDLGSREVTRDQVSSSFRFEDREAYLAEYAADRAQAIAGVEASCPEPGPELRALFTEHFNRLGRLSEYFNDRIDMTVRFTVNGPHGGQWDVALNRDGVTVGEGLTDKPSYHLTVDGRWLLPVLTGKMSWEGLLLSLRVRFYRDPDVYNDYLVGLLKHADAEALRAVEKYDTARHSGERITVEDGFGDTYEVSRFCPHAGEDLSVGAVVEGRRLTCLRHDFTFDLTTGQCLNARSRRLAVSRLSPSAPSHVRRSPAMPDPTLYDRQHWPEVQVWASYTEELPPAELVQSVHVVAMDAAGNICVCKDDEGNVFLPGGTREPGESILRCAVRELREEAGLTVTGGVRWFGAHMADGYKPTPYRPHLPHPKKAWLWGVCEAVQDGPPTNPPGAEQVTSVQMLPVAEVQDALSRVKSWYPELIERACHFRERGPVDQAVAPDYAEAQQP
jgi:8-oxo-dGTP pyrophosphatase MutT (NUDIX family)/nitrite reductase/ring-hydroxylating ferredoxin subunit